MGGNPMLPAIWRQNLRRKHDYLPANFEGPEPRSHPCLAGIRALRPTTDEHAETARGTRDKLLLISEIDFRETWDAKRRSPARKVAQKPHARTSGPLHPAVSKTGKVSQILDF